MNDKKVQITTHEISEAQGAGEPTIKQECLKNACEKIEELALLDFDQLSPDSCVFVDRILIKPDGSFICKLVEHRTITVPERKLNIADNELESIKRNLLSFVSEQPSTKKWPPLEFGNS
jgi:hypothetical protein